MRAFIPPAVVSFVVHLIDLPFSEDLVKMATSHSDVRVSHNLPVFSGVYRLYMFLEKFRHGTNAVPHHLLVSSELREVFPNHLCIRHNSTLFAPAAKVRDRFIFPETNRSHRRRLYGFCHFGIRLLDLLRLCFLCFCHNWSYLLDNQYKGMPTQLDR